MTKRVELACPAGSLPALRAALNCYHEQFNAPRLLPQLQIKRVICNSDVEVAIVAFASLCLMAEGGTHPLGAFGCAWQ